MGFFLLMRKMFIDELMLILDVETIPGLIRYQDSSTRLLPSTQNLEKTAVSE